MHHPVNLFRVFTDRLNELGVQYMVTGSVAAMIYGEPRLTHDIDIVLKLAFEDAESLIAAFPLSEFYAPPIESLRVEIRRNIRGHFNLIHHESGFKADIYLSGQDPKHEWAFTKRRNVTLGDAALWLAPPEYVIVKKFDFFAEGGSEKHLRDIAAILEATPDLEKSEIIRWLDLKNKSLFEGMLSKRDSEEKK